MRVLVLVVLVLVIPSKVRSTPSPRPKTGVRQKAQQVLSNKNLIKGNKTTNNEGIVFFTHPVVFSDSVR